MKPVYLPALASFVVGSGMLIANASSDPDVSILGVALGSPVVRGLGIIVLILGSIVLLAAYGSTLPPRQQETRLPGRGH